MKRQEVFVNSFRQMGLPVTKHDIPHYVPVLEVGSLLVYTEQYTKSHWHESEGQSFGLNSCALFSSMITSNPWYYNCISMQFDFHHQ